MFLIIEYISWILIWFKFSFDFSSIGLAKAALESMNGFNLYGDNGCSWSVVYVDIDAHNRNRTTLETLLPRESSSKVNKNNFNIHRYSIL